MSAQWFAKIAGKDHGPFTVQQLVQLARTKQLQPTDLVRKDNSGWVIAVKVKGLFPHAEVKSSDTSGANSEMTADWTAPNAAPKEPEEHSDEASGSNVLDSPGEAPREGVTQIIRGLEPGSRLGNYQILDTLGEGGMGVVLKAQHMRMDRIVALKVLRSQAVLSANAVSRFQKEVRAAARLSHTNIVTAYDADEVNGLHFLVMEYVDGGSLAELLGKRRKLEVEEVVKYIIQTARGLEYAHSEGIVHRDIKPGNLLIDKRGTIKILDMGLASMKEAASDGGAPALRDGEFVTQENQLLGTFDYMAPEQAEDAHSADHRADIYSLGCTLYRLLTGKLPFNGESPLKKILAHRDHPIPSLRALRPDAPFHIDSVFQRMLAKKRENRQPSMTDVIADLEACMAGRARAGATAIAGGYGDSGIFREEPGSSASTSAILRSDEKSVFIPAPSSDDDDGDDIFCGLTPVTDYGLTPVTDHGFTVGTDERYYWQVMGQQTGPFTLAQLKAKRVMPDDLVRLEHDSKWMRAEDLKGLR